MECPFKKLQRLGDAIPVLSYKGIHPLSHQQIKEWALLDTFDMLATKYDYPQTIDSVKRWFTGANLMDVEVDDGIFARGKKK